MTSKGERVRAMRQRAGLSRRALTERIRADGRGPFGAITLQRIETGYSEPRESTLARIADALGLTLDELLEGPPSVDESDRADVVSALRLIERALAGEENELGKAREYLQRVVDRHDW